jgi:hypothetical protein
MWRPKGPGYFFPCVTLARVAGNCVWESGNMANGRSFGSMANGRSLGPDKQFGQVGPGTIGACTGRILPRPSC